MGEKSSRSRPPRKPKTAGVSAPTLIPQPKGGALLSGGVPGNAGGGRPPKAFKDFLAELRKDPEVQSALGRAARDETGRNFKAALDVITDYDDAKPAKKIEVSEPLSNAQRAARIEAIMAAVKPK